MTLKEAGFRVPGLCCVTAALAFAVAGCGASEKKGSSTGGGGSTEPTSSAGGSSAAGLEAAKAEVKKLRGETTAFTPPGPRIDASPLTGKTVWYIPLSASIAGLSGNGQGVKEAAKALGLQYKTCDGKFQPAQVSACLRQASNSKPAGIVTNSVDPANVAPAIKAAAQAKIPIMSLNGYGKESDTLRFIGNGNQESAAAAMNWIIADSNGKANVFAVNLTGSVQVDQDAAASKKPLKENCPACQYRSIELGDGQLDTVSSATSTALLRNPKANYGFSIYDFSAPDFERGARQAGRTNTMKLVSSGGTANNLKEIASGGFQVANAGPNSNQIGWQAMDRLLRLILRKPPADKLTYPVRMFDNENVRSLRITTDAQASGEWFGRSTYKQEFPTLWGVW